MSGYVVVYERPNGNKGYVLTNEENGPCEMEVFRSLAEAEGVVQEMIDNYGYAGLKYSVDEIGREWR